MRMERTPATRAVAAAMSARFGADVGHREEGNYSASDLLSY